MFGPAIELVRQLIAGGGSKSVNEYSIMNLNEFGGFRPIGLDLMITAVVVPTLVALYCLRNWCCACTKCCSPKKERTSSLTDSTPIKSKKRGLKRFLLPRRSDKEAGSKQQRTASPEDTIRYDIEAPTGVAEEKEVPLFIRRAPEGLKIYTDAD